ncbi:MAG: hypothetical protein V3U03_17380 [Myxococcota bacterium]
MALEEVADAVRTLLDRPPDPTSEEATIDHLCALLTAYGAMQLLDAVEQRDRKFAIRLEKAGDAGHQPTNPSPGAAHAHPDEHEDERH